MRYLAITFLATLMGVSVAQAAPLDTAAVSGQAKWVAHVNVDAIRDSYVVKKAFETCPLLKEKAPAAFDKLHEKLGMDLRKDLHGVTLYGNDVDKEHGVMIVYAEVNQKLLIEKAEKAKDHKVAKHGDIAVHSWTMTGPHGKTHAASGAFYKPNVLVFASSPERVNDALDVLAGKSAALASDSPLATEPLPGTSFLVRATAVDPKMPCAILAKASSFRVALGEHDGKSFYRANVEMKSSEEAQELNKVIEGFRALATLRHGSEKDAMKLINGFKNSVDGATVKVRWDASAEDVWTVVDKASKKIAEQIKAHCMDGEHGWGKKKADDKKCDKKCDKCDKKGQKSSDDKF